MRRVLSFVVVLFLSSAIAGEVTMPPNLAANLERFKGAAFFANCRAPDDVREVLIVDVFSREGLLLWLRGEDLDTLNALTLAIRPSGPVAVDVGGGAWMFEAAPKHIDDLLSSGVKFVRPGRLMEAVASKPDRECQRPASNN
jgi:hypothetical protein